MGLRDQNNGKKIGINGSRIYHVTTLIITLFRWKDFPDLADLVDFLKILFHPMPFRNRRVISMFGFDLALKILNQRYMQ